MELKEKSNGTPLGLSGRCGKPVLFTHGGAGDQQPVGWFSQIKRWLMASQHDLRAKAQFWCHDLRAKAQFWCAVIAVAGAVAITGIAVVVDVYRGQKSDLTMLLAGGLLSLGSASAGWLFRDGGPTVKNRRVTDKETS